MDNWIINYSSYLALYAVEVPTMDYKPIIPKVEREKDKKKDLLKHVNMKQAIADWYVFEKELKHEK